MLREKSLILEPGKEHFVDMSGIRVSTDASAEKLDIHHRFFMAKKVSHELFLGFRGCYFKERELEYHTIYSFGSCIFECKMMVKEDIF